MLKQNEGTRAAEAAETEGHRGSVSCTHDPSHSSRSGRPCFTIVVSRNTPPKSRLDWVGVLLFCGELLRHAVVSGFIMSPSDAILHVSLTCFIIYLALSGDLCLYPGDNEVFADKREGYLEP